jgi:hypothetical protein
MQKGTPTPTPTLALKRKRGLNGCPRDPHDKNSKVLRDNGTTTHGVKTSALRATDTYQSGVIHAVILCPALPESECFPSPTALAERNLAKNENSSEPHLAYWPDNYNCNRLKRISIMHAWRVEEKARAHLL